MPLVGFEPLISAGERPKTVRLLGPALILQLLTANINSDAESNNTIHR